MLLRYYVSYHNEEWEPGSTDEPVLNEMGLVSCSDYNDAVDKLNHYYGSENIYEFRFVPFEAIVTQDDFLDKHFWD